MVDRYFQFANLISFEHYNLDRTTHAEAQLSIQKVLGFLESGRQEVISRLSLLLANMASQRKVQILRSAGLADWVILILLERLPELGEIERGKLGRLVGLAPDGQKGREGLREVLYVETEGLVSTSPTFRAFYAKSIASGKVHKVAVLICLRKLITSLNACIKSDELWNYGPDDFQPDSV